jgi:hypothetical protein
MHFTSEHIRPKWALQLTHWYQGCVGCFCCSVCRTPAPSSCCRLHQPAGDTLPCVPRRVTTQRCRRRARRGARGGPRRCLPTGAAPAVRCGRWRLPPSPTVRDNLGVPYYCPEHTCTWHCCCCRTYTRQHIHSMCSAAEADGMVTERRCCFRKARALSRCTALKAVPTCPIYSRWI